MGGGSEEGGSMPDISGDRSLRDRDYNPEQVKASPFMVITMPMMMVMMVMMMMTEITIPSRSSHQHLHPNDVYDDESQFCSDLHIANLCRAFLKAKVRLSKQFWYKYPRTISTRKIGL